MYKLITMFSMLAMLASAQFCAMPIPQMSGVFSPLDLNPLVWYKLDGNLDDATTNGYTATPTSITYTTGVNGQSASFNGISSKIITDVKPSPVLGFTASLWIFAPDGSSGARYLVQQWHAAGAGNSSWGIVQTTANILRFATYSVSSRTHTTLYTSNHNDGTWHHLVMTYFDSTIKWYFDGSLAGSVVGNSMQESTNYYVIIGVEGTSYHWLGEIDDVLIFEKALSAEDIKQIYEWRE